MKIMLQIAFILCFSLTAFAQDISCERLMQLPLGKYLYDNNSDSLVFVMNNLERCGFETFETEHSIVSIFISNIVGEKGKAATVQDLYNEVLIFRRQNTTEVIKHDLAKKELFYKNYSKETASIDNWETVKPMLMEVFGFDETDLNEFATTLFEAKKAITYEDFVDKFRVYLKETYHLTKVATSTESDFSSDRTENEFPSMNYFERQKSNLNVGKLTLVYFYGNGAVNCQKLHDNSFYNPNLCKLIQKEFNFITLCVDDRTPLPTDLKSNLEQRFPKGNFRDVGRYSLFIQKQIAFADIQPYFVVLDDFGHILLEADYEKVKDSEEFVKALSSVLESRKK